MNEPLFQHGICKELAKKYGMDEETVKKVVYYQYKFVSNIMSQGNFESVRLPSFGKFYVNPKRLEHIQRKSKEKNARTTS